MLLFAFSVTMIFLLGGVGGVYITRHLWHHVIREGEPHVLLPARLVPLLFGDFAKPLTDSRRTRIENDSLRRELAQFSSTLNLAPFPIWRRDASLHINYCNLIYNTMLEDVPEHVLEEFGLELDVNARKLAENALASKTQLVERRHMIVEGERKLYQVFEIPDLDSGGTVGFALDVSTQEAVEEELRRHIDAYGDLLESSNMATAIFGADKHLKFYNTAFMSLWKLDKHTLEAKPTYGELLEILREKRRLPEETNFPMFKQQRMKLFTDLMEPREEIMHLPDGKILRMMIIPHALGGLIFSYEDVTDRVALEGSYNTLIAVQSATLDNLHEGVAVFGEDGRLRLSNPVYRKLWGLNENFTRTEPHISEVLEATKSYYVFKSWDEFKERMVTQLQSRKMNYQRVERTDSSMIDWSTVPLPDGATLITYFDVTDSTLVERSLIEKNEALREADTLKTEFLLSVSYELRSPLTSIIGFTEILKEQYFGKMNEKQTEYVQAIFEASTHLGQLINNILDLASIEAGYMRLEIKDLAVPMLLDEIYALVKERAKNDKIEMKLECPVDIGVLQADEARIKQVLFNLLANAVKYTLAGGTITLGVRAADPENLAIWVEDTGMGIPENEQKTVFERFRAGKLRTQMSGAGLGLAMVKNFIELHGGRVELKSEVGKGTCITCYVPRKHQTVYTVEHTAIENGSNLAELLSNGTLH